MVEVNVESKTQSPPAVPLSKRLAGWQWFALVCLGVLALSFVLNADHPTGGFELCAMKRLTGQPCPGCGVTRAIIRCSHGEFAQAFHQHPLGVPLWLLAIVGATSLVWPRRWRDALAGFYGRRQRLFHAGIYVLIVALLAFGILRIVFLKTAAPAWWPW